ncbi:hypothetical protein ACLB2K_059934 [Fragaria x ananassa]
MRRHCRERFEGKCFNCDKTGHKAVDCNKPKKKKSKEAYMIEDVTRDVSDINLSVVVSEVNMVGSNPKEWWLDTGATRHVCANKKKFSKFEPTTDGEIMYMGNSTTSVIEDKGNVFLKMTSGKELTLNNVLYVPDIRKNFISGALLNTHGGRRVEQKNAAQTGPDSRLLCSDADRSSVVRPSTGARLVSTGPYRRPRPHYVLLVRRGAPAREKRRREVFSGLAGEISIPVTATSVTGVDSFFSMSEPFYAICLLKGEVRRENRLCEAQVVFWPCSSFSSEIWYSTQASKLINLSSYISL